MFIRQETCYGYIEDTAYYNITDLTGRGVLSHVTVRLALIRSKYASASEFKQNYTWINKHLREDPEILTQAWMSTKNNIHKV
jgi:hypothetical protein